MSFQSHAPPSSALIVVPHVDVKRVLNNQIRPEYASDAVRNSCADALTAGIGPGLLLGKTVVDIRGTVCKNSPAFPPLPQSVMWPVNALTAVTEGTPGKPG